MKSFIEYIKSQDNIWSGIILALPIIVAAYYRWFGVVVSLLFLACLIRYSSRIGQLLKNKISPFLIVFFMLYLLALLYSQSFQKGIQEVGQKLSFLLTAFILIGEIDTKFIKKGGLWFAYIISLVSCYFFVYRIAFEADIGLIKTITYSNLVTVPLLKMQPTYFSMYVLMAIFILYNYRKQHLLISSLLILFLITTLIFLGNRSQILIFIICSTFLFFIEIRKYYSLSRFVLFLTVIILIPIVLIKINPDLLYRFKTMTYAYEEYKSGKQTGISHGALRLHKWKSSIDLIKENPWLGTSPADFMPELLKKYQENGFEEGLNHKYNSHNLYLQIWGSLGIMGLISILLLYGSMLFTSIKNRNKLQLLFSLIIILSSLTESIFERLSGIAFFCTFLILFFADSKRKELS